MKTYFVTRHIGAIEWANENGFSDAEKIAHFDPPIVKSGDNVIGILPIHLAAEVFQRGGNYFHLSIETPPEAQGKELTKEELYAFNAKIEEYLCLKKQKQIQVTGDTWAF